MANFRPKKPLGFKGDFYEDTLFNFLKKAKCKPVMVAKGKAKDLVPLKPKVKRRKKDDCWD